MRSTRRRVQSKKHDWEMTISDVSHLGSGFFYSTSVGRGSGDDIGDSSKEGGNEKGEGEGEGEGKVGGEDGNASIDKMEVGDVLAQEGKQHRGDRGAPLIKEAQSSNNQMHLSLPSDTVLSITPSSSILSIRKPNSPLILPLLPILVFLLSLLLLTSTIFLLQRRNRKIARKHLGLEFTDDVTLDGGSDEIRLLDEYGNDDDEEGKGYTKVEKVTRRGSVYAGIVDAVEKSGEMIEEEVRKISLSSLGTDALVLVNVDSEPILEGSSRDAEARTPMDWTSVNELGGLDGQVALGAMLSSCKGKERAAN